MFFEIVKQGIILRVRLQPNSSCCKTTGFFTTPDGLEYLKVNVISVPEKGQANRELITFLAKKLKLAKSSFQIIFGELDRYKKILIMSDDKDISPLIEQLKVLGAKQ